MTFGVACRVVGLFVCSFSLWNWNWIWNLHKLSLFWRYNSMMLLLLLLVLLFSEFKFLNEFPNPFVNIITTSPSTTTPSATNVISTFCLHYNRQTANFSYSQLGTYISERTLAEIETETLRRQQQQHQQYQLETIVLFPLFYGFLDSSHIINYATISFWWSGIPWFGLTLALALLAKEPMNATLVVKRKC